MILAAAKWIAVLALATLTAGFGSCNGGGGNPPEYVLQGSVSGLLPGESVVLQDFGSDTTTVSANGHFQFSRPVPGGAPYSITMLTQPNGQNCTTLNGSGTGTIGAGSLVSVACIVLGYTVSGTIQYATGPAVLELVNGQDGLVPIGPSVTVTEPQYNVPVAFTLISTAPIGTPYDVEFVSGPAHEGLFLRRL